MFTSLWSPSTPDLPWAAVICGSLIAAMWDVRTRRIPNWLTGSLLIGGAIWSACVGGWSGLGNNFLACLLLAIPFVMLFIFAGGGAADAKLMGAIGMWLGLRHGLVVLVCVMIAGAVMGLVFALMKRRLESVFLNLATTGFGLVKLLKREHSWSNAAEVMPDEKEMLIMPYGLSIFVGVLVGAWGVLVWNWGWIQ